MLKDATITYFEPTDFNHFSSAYMRLWNFCQQTSTQTGLVPRESNPRRHVLNYFNDQSFFGALLADTLHNLHFFMFYIWRMFTLILPTSQFN